jgi:hypothetical protein
MEVHHPHHPTHKKNWSEYIIEFVMLFTAVTLGFFAENIREHLAEKEKKKELLQTVARDFETDLKQFEFHKNFGQEKIKNCDSLIAINNGDQSKVDQKQYYALFLKTIWWWHFNPNEKSRNEAEAKGYFSEKENSELNFYISKFNFFKTDLKDMEVFENETDKVIISELANFTEHKLLDKQLRFPSIEIPSKIGIKKIDPATANRMNYQYSMLKLCSDIYIMNIDSMTVYAKKAIDLINKEYK